MTPAQVSGHDFVTEVATQGPTDEGIRAFDCHYAQTQLPTRPTCAPCSGPVPEWTVHLAGVALDLRRFV